MKENNPKHYDREAEENYIKESPKHYDREIEEDEIYYDFAEEDSIKKLNERDENE